MKSSSMNLSEARGMHFQHVLGKYPDMRASVYSEAG